MVFSLCAGIQVNPIVAINYQHGENRACLLEEQRLSRSQPSTDAETPHSCHEGLYGDTVIYVHSNASSTSLVLYVSMILIHDVVPRVDDKLQEVG